MGSDPSNLKSLGKLNALCIWFIVSIHPLACIYLGLFALEESGDGKETSLAVYWFRLLASTAGQRLDSWWGNYKIPHAAWCDQEKKEGGKETSEGNDEV